jgi:hypothetical protein
MRCHDPPSGSGSGAEWKRVVGELPLIRSDAGPATPSSSLTSRLTTIPPAARSTRLVIVLKPRGHGRFDALFNGAPIVAASSQAIPDAARVLHRLGYDDDFVLVAWHANSNHEAIRGPIGVWRRVRIREDRRGLRLVRWEPFPSRRVRANKRDSEAGGAARAPTKIGPPRPIPGAA